MLLSIATPLSAGIISDTFGPGDQHWGGGFPIGQTSQFRFAVGFGSSQPFFLDRIELPLRHVSGTNSLRILITDEEDGVPGSTLAYWDVFDLAAFGTTSPLVVLSSTLTDLFAGNTTYFLVVQAIDTSTFGLWHGSLSAVGTLYVETNGGPWTGRQDYGLPAYRIVASSGEVPEPASVVLISAGFVCLVLLRQHPRIWARKRTRSTN